MSPRLGVGRRAPGPFLLLLAREDSASPAHPAGSAPLGSAPASSRALPAAGSPPPWRKSFPTLRGVPASLRQDFLGAAPRAHGCQTHRVRGSLLAHPGIAASPSQGAGVGTDWGGDPHEESGDKGVAPLPLYTPRPRWGWASALPLECPRVWRPWQKKDGAGVEGRAGQGPLL